MEIENYQEKLKGLIKEMIDDKTKDQAMEFAAETNEKIAKLMEQNSELRDQIEKLMATPAKKVDLPIPGEENKTVPFYKGYNVAKQGMDLKIADNSVREKIAKFVIDAIHGKAAMQEGTTTEGGYLVFDEYENMILAHARESSVMLQDALVLPMGSDTLHLPTESTGITVATKAEETALGQSEPTVSEVQLTARKMGAYSIVSNELLEDSQFDIVSWLTGLFAEAIAKKIDSLGFGGSETWSGALSGANYTVSCAATATSPNRHIQLTVDELSYAIAQLTGNKLAGSKFYLHRNSLHYVRISEDGAGNKVWAAPGGGVPGTIYEYPYSIVDNGIGASPDAATAFALFGNLKKGYVIGRRRGAMVLEVDPYGKFLEYQTRFRMVTRWHGQVGLDTALVAIKTHA